MKSFLISILSVAGLLMAMPSSAAELSVGDTAPDFTLQASDGKTYKLSEFKGKQPVVVAWFPAAFTRGCTIECKSLAENSDKIRQFNVSYFMASVDPLEGEKGNKAFAEAQGATFPLLSDPNKQVAAAYGVLNEKGVANRWTFYIDKNGKITAIDKAVQPATSAEDMLAKLKDLRVETRP